MDILFISLFIVMLTLPMWLSYFFYKKNKVDPVYIDQNRQKDARYFAKSFSAMFEKALEKYDGSGYMQFSKKEKILEFGAKKRLPKVCEDIVYANVEEFCPPSQTRFHKEIYAAKDAILNDIPSIRAAYSRGNMILGYNTNVVRWADAKGTLTVYDDSDTGISVSSETAVMMGKNISFKRVYSPENHFGTYPTEQISDTMLPKNTFVSEEILYDVEFLNENCISKAGENEKRENDYEIKTTVVSKRPVTLVEKFHLLGNIKSHGVVRICDNSIVNGNIFAEKSIILEDNCVVLGTLFSQEEIVIGKNCVVGQSDKIISVVARDTITIGEKSRIYGYISAEKGGVSCPRNSQEVDLKEETKENTVRVAKDYMPMPVHVTELMLSKETYADVDSDGFRHNKHIQKAVFQEGIESVRKSLFFDCENLATVQLPTTVTTIKDYAFFGCVSLNENIFDGLDNLTNLGDYSFEGCEAFSDLKLPNSVVEIGKAAFNGCINLKSVYLGENLKGLGEHAFAYCTKLKEISLPKTIENVSMHVFYGCDSLEKIYAPDTLNEQSVENLPKNVQIIYYPNKEKVSTKTQSK